MYTAMILLWLWPQVHVPEFVYRSESWASNEFMIEKQIGDWYIGTSLQDCIVDREFAIEVRFEW